MFLHNCALSKCTNTMSTSKIIMKVLLLLFSLMMSESVFAGYNQDFQAVKETKEKKYFDSDSEFLQESFVCHVLLIHLGLEETTVQNNFSQGI